MGECGGCSEAIIRGLIMEYQELKKGDNVELRGDKNFWYTVDNVHGDMVQLKFGDKGANAGTYHVNNIINKKVKF